MVRETDRPDPIRGPIDLAFERFNETLDAAQGVLAPSPAADPLVQWAHSRGLPVGIFRGKRSR